MVRRAALAACGALLMIGAAAPPARTFVVRSIGPDAKAWPKGKSLANGTWLKLRQGSVVQILDTLGTRTFRGPGSFVIGSASIENSRTDQLGRSLAADERRSRSAAVSLSQMKALLSAGSRRQLTRIGAVRGSSDESDFSRRRRWHELAIGQSGTFCAADPMLLPLWRSNTSMTERVEMRASPGRKTYSAGFYEGLARASVMLGTAADTPPRKLTYVMPDGDTIKVRLVALSEGDKESLTSLYAALNDKGCTGQAEALVGDVEDAEALEASPIPPAD